MGAGACAPVNSYGLDDLPAPEALIDGILYRDTLAWLHGKPGCGKSFIALDWAGASPPACPGRTASSPPAGGNSAAPRRGLGHAAGGA